ncbi:hypothetical protein N7489_003736 [Penicillium chrysogenum]|uniref:uncharacterized protein n=1 Tax=Penicillium chrysogenum TaxID=5076 RepID=UPI0023990341|nr:uncharacterized protein N7489_003736 [Penicillium chrysogenum]KAJ5243640.1 hypothetical protein N7489_003736 [Penicillium chrysogenum]KAJ5257411.1 hypothetical protein N7524_008967 [Penicillium chrysogenum]
MAQIPDLIRDSKLETYFLPDCTVETVHRFQESDSASGQRLVTRLEHWRRQRRVGNGGFGTVWLEECIKAGRPGGTQDGTVRAVKQIDMDTRFGSIDYNRELEAIAKFSHSRYERCFVKSFGWYEGPGQLFIAMEYLETGDLFAYLYQKPLPPLPEAEAKEIAYQILDGMCMMHENGFAHRDLKPNNILIKAHPPDKWWIKLADFGITKRIEESHGQSTTIKGTPRYFAPEIWGFVERGSAYAIDIWAVGEIVFEILTKKPAFATPGLLAGYKAKQDFPVIMLTDAGVSQPGVDFVLSLMCPRPNDRMTATSAISDAWIQSPMLQPLGSTKAIEGEPRVSSPATIMTEVSTSWTTRTYSKAPGDVSHDMPGSTTTVELVNAAQDKTIAPQGKSKIHSSLGTRVPVIMQGQGQVKTPEFRPVEFRSQHQTGLSLYYQKRYKEAETMFREALQGREKTLGPNHEDTLNSTHRLGLTLYYQKRYKEAEIEFRRALQGREKLLGPYHGDTLYSAHSLGLSLYRQECYEEAETVFRQALQGRDRVLGHNHEETLSSTHWLGLSLYYQKRYKEAEIEFRRALQGREETLGYDHKDTLYSANQLAMSLYDQDQYKEAETMSRRALEGREKLLGHDNEETLNSAHRLGLTLYYQKQYKVAAPMFRRALLGREKTLGYDHRHTLYSAYWLGLSLYYQKRYKEAETMLRRTLQGREKTLGHDHEETVNARECMDKAHARALGL